MIENVTTFSMLKPAIGAGVRHPLAGTLMCDFD
jgi:hypothetical protein